MPTDTDPIGALLADDLLSEALRFAVLTAYASGWSHAFGTQLRLADSRLAQIVEEAGDIWQARLIARRPMEPPIEPPIPTWLAALQEAHEPAPWGD